MNSKDLFEKGYIGLSNKYRIVARIDRPDWLQYMAAKTNRSVADFYYYEKGKLGNSTGRWGEHYCSVYSKDKIEGIDPDVYLELKRLNNYRSEVTYIEI